MRAEGDHGEFGAGADEGSGPSWGAPDGSVLLGREFFVRSALEVAPELLGCLLWHVTSEGTVAGVITEVEAYTGRTDPASHAYRGETARNAVMFGPPGHAYVYFTYGMHFCVNLVCEPAGEVSAVLLRAARVVAGEELAARRRLAGRTPAAGRGIAERDLARGPARLCQALDIDRSLDGADVCVADSPLGVGAPAGWSPAPASAISAGPRVGVSQAADRPWRFWLTGEPTVSVYRRSVPRARPARTPDQAPRP
jgi:DNA-3-methyladenine glycosylase